MENTDTKKVMRGLFIVSLTLVCVGVLLISFSTVWGFSAMQAKMASGYLDGYPTGEEIVFWGCLAMQKIIIGGILSLIGGGILLIWAYWRIRIARSNN